MVEIPRRNVFFSQRDFQHAWKLGSKPLGLIRGLRSRHQLVQKSLSDAAHFLGGALLSEGFALFHNGGLPLLERRSGKLIEEILLHPNPNSRDDRYVPIRIGLHLSHAGLQTTRMRYWNPPSRAPSSIASIDLGALEMPPRWVIWNLGLDHETLIDLVDSVQALALPWFKVFENERELYRRLFRLEISHVGLDTALELVIAEFGEYEGARFLSECILSDPKLGSRVREQSLRILRAQRSGGVGHDQVTNLATIAACFGLLGK